MDTCRLENTRPAFRQWMHKSMQLEVLFFFFFLLLLAKCMLEQILFFGSFVSFLMLLRMRHTRRDSLASLLVASSGRVFSTFPFDSEQDGGTNESILTTFCRYEERVECAYSVPWFKQETLLV